MQDVKLEAVVLPHFEGEKVMVAFFGLLARGVLSEECFSYFLKTTERAGRQRVEPI